MLKKRLTNEQMFKNLFKELHTLEVATLRNILVPYAKKVKKDVAKNPQKYYNPIVHVSIYTRVCDKVEKHLGFNE